MLVTYRNLKRSHLCQLGPQQSISFYVIWSIEGVERNYLQLGGDAVCSVKHSEIFQMILLPPSSGIK